MLLDKRASIWRKVNVAGVFGDTQIFSNIACAIVPVSRFDLVSPYAYESTDLIWVPHWIVLHKEDQVRYGRRLPDAFGNVVPWTYVINGRREFTQSVRQLCFYGRIMD